MTAHRVEISSLTTGQKLRATLILPLIPIIVPFFLAWVAVREWWRAFMELPAGDGVGGPGIDDDEEGDESCPQ